MWKLAVGAVLLLAGELWGVPSKYTFPADTVVMKRGIADSLTAQRITVSDSARFAKLRGTSTLADSLRATKWALLSTTGNIGNVDRRSILPDTMYKSVIDIGVGTALLEYRNGTYTDFVIGSNTKIGSDLSLYNTKTVVEGRSQLFLLSSVRSGFFFSPLKAANTTTSFGQAISIARGLAGAEPVLGVTSVSGDSVSPIFLITSTGSAGTDVSKKFASFVANTTEKFYVLSTGAVYNNGTYGTISDSVMKTEIQDAVDAGSKVGELKIKTFKFKDDLNKTHTGVVAQDVQAVYPELVENIPLGRDSSWTDENGVTQHKMVDVPTLVVNMQGFIPVLIAHAQEQDRSILELQTAVAGLLTALAGLGVLVQSLRKKLNALIALHPEAGVTEEEK